MIVEDLPLEDPSDKQESVIDILNTVERSTGLALGELPSGNFMLEETKF